MLKEENYVLPGVPSVRDIVAPISYPLVETNLTGVTAWKKVWVERPSVFRPTRAQGPHELQYTNKVPTEITYDEGTFYTAESGLCIMKGRGNWYVRCPRAGSSDLAVKCVLLDGQSDALMPIIAAGEDPNAWTGKFEPRVFQDAGAAVGVTTTSGLKLAARQGRRFVSVRAGNFAGGCTKVTYYFKTPVVSLVGFVLEDEDEDFWDALDGVSEQAIYAVTDVGTADLYFNEAV